MTTFIDLENHNISNTQHDKSIAVNGLEDLQAVSTRDLLEIYNNLAASPIQKFRDRETAVQRVFNMITQKAKELAEDDQPASTGGAMAWIANEANLAARAADIAGIKPKTKIVRKRAEKQEASTLDKIKEYITTGEEFTLKSLAEKFSIKESTAGVFVSTLKSKTGDHKMPITIDRKTKVYKIVQVVEEKEAA